MGQGGKFGIALLAAGRREWTGGWCASPAVRNLISEVQRELPVHSRPPVTATTPASRLAPGRSRLKSRTWGMGWDRVADHSGAAACRVRSPGAAIVERLPTIRGNTIANLHREEVRSAKTRARQPDSRGD